MSKGIKTLVLKHWYTVDNMLLGGPSKRIIENEDVRKNYLTTKAAMLANTYEIYRKLKLNPDIKYSTVREMYEASIKDANIFVKRANKILTNEQVVMNIKDEIESLHESEGLDEGTVSRYVVKRRRNAVALDSLMLEPFITENNKASLTDWVSKVLLDSHKTLRDSLIEVSMMA